MCASRGSLGGTSCAATASTASTTVLPIRSTRSGSTCSRSSASAARRVGARCRSATTPISLRLASSGNGEERSPERSPASRCTSGIRRHIATRPPTSTDVVSPCTTTAAERSRTSTSSRAGASSATSSTCSPERRSRSIATSGRSPKALSAWVTMAVCWPVATSTGRTTPEARRAATSGAIFTASGRVPTTTCTTGRVMSVRSASLDGVTAVYSFEGPKVLVIDGE